MTSPHLEAIRIQVGLIAHCQDVSEARARGYVRSRLNLSSLYRMPDERFDEFMALSTMLRSTPFRIPRKHDVDPRQVPLFEVAS